MNFFLQGTGYLADIVAKLCQDLRSNDELIQAKFQNGSKLPEKLKEKKVKDVQECIVQLEKLWHPAGENTGQANAKIQKCVNVLIEMNALIVIFDADKFNDNLEDAIADALLKQISYRRKNVKEFNDYYGSRAEELKWCLVKFSLSL